MLSILIGVLWVPAFAGTTEIAVTIPPHIPAQ
jgi:hypothetical protein